MCLLAISKFTVDFLIIKFNFDFIVFEFSVVFIVSKFFFYGLYFYCSKRCMSFSNVSWFHVNLIVDFIVINVIVDFFIICLSFLMFSIWLSISMSLDLLLISLNLFVRFTVSCFCWIIIIFDDNILIFCCCCCCFHRNACILVIWKILSTLEPCMVSTFSKKKGCYENPQKSNAQHENKISAVKVFLSSSLFSLHKVKFITSWKFR